MKFIRWILGKVILLLNAVFSPRGIKRTNEAQSNVDDKAKQYALYQFEACPFCVKVRRAMKRQSVNIELRDAKNDPTHRAELEQGGGRVKVPCLRIEKDGETQWLYESSDIVAYLEKRICLVPPKNIGGCKRGTIWCLFSILMFLLLNRLAAYSSTISINSTRRLHALPLDVALLHCGTYSPNPREKTR